MNDFIESLRMGARSMGVDLDENAIERLAAHQALLSRWMQRINLTAISGPRDMVDRLYLDCLVMVGRLEEGCRLHDVGSGAGFPGLVIKAVRPDVEVTLTEARHKRVSFLRQAARDMGLMQGLDIQWRRLGWEQQGTQEPANEKSVESDDHRGGEIEWSEVISRATFPPREWLRRGSALVQPGGRIWVMAGHAVEGESENFQQAETEWTDLLRELGLEMEEEIPYRLPFCGLERRLLAFRKCS